MKTLFCVFFFACFFIRDTCAISPPQVTTEQATNVLYTTATLNGIINPQGSSTSYWFYYRDFVETVWHETQHQTLNAGFTNLAVHEDLSGLIPGHNYYFKLHADNGIAVEGLTEIFSTKEIIIERINPSSMSGSPNQQIQLNYHVYGQGSLEHFPVGSVMKLWICDENNLSSYLWCGDVTNNPTQPFSSNLYPVFLLPSSPDTYNYVPKVISTNGSCNTYSWSFTNFTENTTVVVGNTGITLINLNQGLVSGIVNIPIPFSIQISGVGSSSNFPVGSILKLQMINESTGQSIYCVDVSLTPTYYFEQTLYFNLSFVSAGDYTIIPKLVSTSYNSCLAPFNWTNQFNQQASFVHITLPNNPPTVTIENPSTGSHVTHSTISVSGDAWDNGPGIVERVQISLNNISWVQATGTQSWIANITLAPGMNTIYARAQDDDLAWSPIVSITVYNDEPMCQLVELYFDNKDEYLYNPANPSYTGDYLYHNREYIIPFGPVTTYKVYITIKPSGSGTCRFCGNLWNRYTYGTEIQYSAPYPDPLYTYNVTDISSQTSIPSNSIDDVQFLKLGELYIEGYEDKAITLSKNTLYSLFMTNCANEIYNNASQNALNECLVSASTDLANLPPLSAYVDAKSSACTFKDINNHPNDPFPVKALKSIILALDIAQTFNDILEFLCFLSPPTAVECVLAINGLNTVLSYANCVLGLSIPFFESPGSSMYYDNVAKNFHYFLSDTSDVGQSLSPFLYQENISFGVSNVNAINMTTFDSICPVEISVKYNEDSLFILQDSLRNPYYVPGILKKFPGINTILSRTDEPTIYHYFWNTSDSIRIRVSDNLNTQHIYSQYTLNLLPNINAHAWYNFMDPSPVLHIDFNENNLEDSIITPDITCLPLVNSLVNYCQFDQSSPLSAIGIDLLWYLSPSGGTGTSTPPIPSTQVIGTIKYYVTQTLNALESQRASISVTVHQLPVPQLLGDSNVCLGESGIVYSTDAGMSNYTWLVDGGVITSRDTIDSIQVTWTSLGDHFVSVNYTDSNGCRALIPVSHEVKVSPLPSITINGPSSVCSGSTNNIYTTENGMSNYSWSLSPGGSVGAGGGASNNFISVKWNSTGQQYVRVNYTDSNGCSALNPKQYDVTVYPLPVITITGPNSVCQGTSGNNYSTRTGMNNYIWSVSPGGTITAGGTSTSNSVTVKWNVADTQAVSVNYTDPNGCTAAAPTVYPVIVHPLPVPVISGPSDLCLGIVGTYLTEPGMSNYTWTYAPGGIKTGGGSSSSSFIKLKWPSTGPKWIKVTYKTPFGCQALLPTNYPITVRPLPNPSIMGPNNVCQGTSGAKYKTQPGKINYIWSVSSGGIVTAGGTSASDSVIVTWNTSGAQWLKVNYSDLYGCTATTSKQFNVTVKPATKPTIYGASSICRHDSAMYLTEGGKLSYSWSVSPGGTIISGWGTKSVWIHWDAAGTQTVTVDYITPTGCPVLNPTTKTVEVRPLPVPSLNGPTTPCINITYMYSTESGMKNYNWSISPGGQIVSGFHSYQVLVKWTLPGARWLKIYYETPYYCKPLIPTKLDIMAVVCASNLSPGTGTSEIDTLPGSDDSQNIPHIITKDGSELSFMLFPNPTEGHFTLQVVTSRAEILNLSIFNIEGKEIYWAPQIQVIGKSDLNIDLSGFPNGIYAVILKNRDQQALKKLILRK